MGNTTLRIERMIRRISQYTIAKETGMVQSRLSIIENEFVIPTEEEKRRIVESLNNAHCGRCGQKLQTQDVTVDMIFPRGEKK